MSDIRWKANRQCPNCKAHFTKDVGGTCPLCLVFLRERSRQPKGTKPAKSSEWTRKVKRLRRRDGDDCWLCGHALGNNITLDHIVPKSKGGANDIGNLRLAHFECNQRRGDADPFEPAEAASAPAVDAPAVAERGRAMNDKPLCPHCRFWHDGRVIKRCPDSQQWTQAERDEWRAQARRRNPSIQFAPSTARMQDRFGARNRADALADARRNQASDERTT